MLQQDEIIEMAKLAGWEMDDSCVLSPQVLWYIYQEQFETFAKLVDAKATAKERESLRESFRVVTAAEASAAILHEREACAKVCDKAHPNTLPAMLGMQIRARGEA